MSDYRSNQYPKSVKNTKIAIVQGDFNRDLGDVLKKYTYEGLEKCSVALENIQEFIVPGALEIPGIVRQLQNSGKFDGVITLGIVIRGGTNHYEIVTEETSRGIMDCTLSSAVPVINGILGANDEEDIKNRLDKGLGFASGAISMILLKKHIS